MFTRFFRIAVSIAALVDVTPIAADHLNVKIAPSMKKYCHIVRFPQGWKPPGGPGLIFHYDSDDSYEFRVQGLLETKFLVGGLILNPRMRYTENKYEVDLSDPKARVLPASDQAWQSATIVSTKQKSAMVQPNLLGPHEPMKFNGFEFLKSGKFLSLDGGRLSPDQRWLVLQSRTGRAAPSEGNGFGCLWLGCHGKIFLDVFNVDNGKKILTMEGTYSGGWPDDLLDGTEWVTERYFIVPMGDHRERCLVCEFGGR